MFDDIPRSDIVTRLAIIDEIDIYKTMELKLFKWMKYLKRYPLREENINLMEHGQLTVLTQTRSAHDQTQIHNYVLQNSMILLKVLKIRMRTLLQLNQKWK